MFDEQTVLQLAGSITLEQATEDKITADTMYASETETVSGLSTELDMSRDALRNWQARIHSDPPEAATVLLKLSLGSSKASLAAAGQMYAAHESEQRVARLVITQKERAVAASEKALEAGEISLMRADLDRQKAAAILLAVGHLQMEKLVHETDTSIEVPLGEKLTSAIDSIVNLQLELNRRESK